MRQKRTTTNNLHRAVSFLNSHLKGEFYARLRHVGYTPLKVSQASVGNLTAVKNAITASRADKANKEWADKVDLLDDIDEKFNKRLTTELINCAYKEKPPDALKNMHPLFRVQFAAAFTLAMQTGRRGEESFKQKLVQRFVRNVELLGVRGTPCGYSLTNKSKRNKVSRREYTTTAPHVDPLKDASANHGAMWMYRFVVMKEPLPNFLDYTTCYDVPTFRKATSIANMSGDSFRDIFKQFFVANQFMVGMITHQCRREVEQMLDDLGCQPENIARMCGHALDQQSRLTNVQTKSYLTNKPLECVLAATGTTTKDRSSYTSVMAHGVSLVPDNLLRYFRKISDLLDMRDKVESDYASCQNLKERKEKRLCTMKHSCERIVFDIKCFFVLCASRPINENGANLLVHAKTFQEEHRNGTLRTIFLDPAFQSQEYLNFRSRIRSLEDQIHLVHLAHPQDLVQGVRGSNSDAVSQLVGVIAALKAEVHALAHNVDRLADNVNSLEQKVDRLEQEGDRRSGVLEIPGKSAAVVANSAADAATNPAAEIRPLDPQENNRRYRQEEILRAEEPTSVLRIELKDSGDNTFDGYIDTYLNEYVTLERQGIEWRADRKVLDSSGNERITSSRAQFWSRRRPLYSLYEIYKEQYKRSQPDSSEEDADKFARRKGEELFQKHKAKNKNETFKNLKRAWEELKNTAEGKELYDNTFLGQQPIKKAKFSSVDQPQEPVAQAASHEALASQEAFHVQRQEQNDLTNPHQHCPGAPALTRGRTLIEQRQNCVGSVRRRVTPRAAAPDAFQQAFGTLSPEEMQQVLEARSQYHQSPTPSELDDEAEALAEYQRAQREKQPRQERRQRAAADRRGMELAKQTNGYHYSRQHNLYVHFPVQCQQPRVPVPGWQPPPPATRNGPRPLHRSLSELIAADRPQLPQFPHGPITTEMVIDARNQRWSGRPEFDNGALHQPRRESFFPAMQEGFKGPSVAERDIDL